MRVYNKTEKDEEGIHDGGHFDDNINPDDEPKLNDNDYPYHTIRYIKNSLKAVKALSIAFLTEKGIIILGFNRTTRTFVHRYFYHGIDDFMECKTLPNPSIGGQLFAKKKMLKDEKDMINEIIKDIINEIIHTKKYLIEMSNQIIDFAIERQETELCYNCLDKLFNLFTEDTVAYFKICNIITKYLQKLNLEFPTYYIKFISITSIVLNPYIHRSYLSNRMKLVGYTYYIDMIQMDQTAQSYWFRTQKILDKVNLFSIYNR